MFEKESRDWMEYRRLPGIRELDLHFSGNRSEARDWAPYHERMDDIYYLVLQNLRELKDEGSALYLLIKHGSSTSRPGKMTSRSQVRKLMRSSDATPYIVRSQSIQHDSVFVAALRKKS